MSRKPSKTTEPPMMMGMAGDDSQVDAGISDWGSEFKARYHGCATLSKLSPEIINDSIQRVVDLDQDSLKVIIKLSPSGLRILDRDDDSILLGINVLQIMHSSVDPEDKKQFVIVTKSTTGVLYCHLFSVKEKARDIPRAVALYYKSRLGSTTSSSPSSSANSPTSPTSPGTFAPSPFLAAFTETISPDCLIFDAEYIGSAPIASNNRDTVVECAVLIFEARKQTVLARLSRKVKVRNADGDSVSILVTPENVRTVDRMTGDPISKEFIKSVSYSCCVEFPDKKKDRDAFAYVSTDERLGRMLCHLYYVRPGDGAFLCKAFNEAFQMAIQDEQRKKTENPFAPYSADREPVKGILYTKQIHRADLTSINTIGAGQFGKVYLATQKVLTPQGQIEEVPRAVKLLRDGAERKDKEDFLREAEVMLQLEDPNLVQIIGVAVQQAPWLVVIEFMPYGDLKGVLETCLEKGVAVTLYEHLMFMVQLSSGLAYMHAKNLIHMDVAARNCLLAANNVAKLGDFGLTKPLDAGKNHFVLRETLRLPLKWIAIEALDYRIFSTASDCWSFGVLMWEILSYGEVPYKTIATQDIQDRVRSGERLPIPAGCPKDLYEAMRRCWDAEPKKRWTLPQLRDAIAEMIKKIPPSKPRDIGGELHSIKSGRKSLIQTAIQQGEQSLRRSSVSAGQGMQRTPTMSQSRQLSGSSVQSGNGPQRSLSRMGTPQVANLMSLPVNESRSPSFSAGGPPQGKNCATCGVSFEGMDGLGVKLHVEFCARKAQGGQELSRTASFTAGGPLQRTASQGIRLLPSN